MVKVVGSVTLGMTEGWIVAGFGPCDWALPLGDFVVLEDNDDEVDWEEEC
jgi:hypothetical protein